MIAHAIPQEAPDAPNDLETRVRTALDTRVRPFMQSHGGDVEIERIEGDHVHVRMFAACGACELKPVTFASRIRSTLLEVPGVAEVECSSVPLSPKRLDMIAEFFA